MTQRLNNVSVASTYFDSVCVLLETLEKIQTNKSYSIGQRRALKRANLKKAMQQWVIDAQLLPIFEFLLPHLDHDRVYFIKEPLLVSVLLEVLGLKGTARGEILQNWNNFDVLNVPSSLDLLRGTRRSEGDLSLIRNPAESVRVNIMARNRDVSENGQHPIGPHLK
jgi:hypothetical protein